MIGRLRLRRVPIDTHREPVAYLSRILTGRPDLAPSVEKIELGFGDRRLVATLNLIDHEDLLTSDEVGLGEAAFFRFGTPEGTLVEVFEAPQPPSLQAVRAKIRGTELTEPAIGQIVADIAAQRYSQTEIAAFLVACAGFLSSAEVLHLTQAMARAGDCLGWAGDAAVDIHSIGGVPGNRVSMIVVPIVAAHGLTIPKTSSRAITSPAGTADTMEVLARVDLDLARMREVVEAEGGCLVWGGHVNLSPADDILIAVERLLGLDAPGQLVASILSKKLAAGVRRLVLEIPVGPSAKVRDEAAALPLRKLFEYVGGQVGIALDIVITDGSQPVGRGVGPALESRDVMKVLRGEPDAPGDLRERGLALAGRVLEFDPALRGGSGITRARELLESGAALRKFRQILLAQGKPMNEAAPGPLTCEVAAALSGTVAAIDCDRIGRIACLAGAPGDKGAGLDLFKKVGERVSAGEPLYRIHACFHQNLDAARGVASIENGLRVVASA